MPELFGVALTRADIERRCGALDQFAGVRLMTLGDGLERGIRMLEFRSGTGLRFTVLVDRAMDIADCDFQGAAIGWHSPSGFRHPGLHEPEGEGGLGWLRSFSGLLVTCGLDHILFMDERDATSFIYTPRQKVHNSIHGRISAIPARLLGYGERWEGDRCFLWCDGIVSQGTVFGEHLELRRRIEIEVGTNTIKLHDVITNRGFYATPHMFCYHINLGYPLLDAGTEYVAPIACSRRAASWMSRTNPHTRAPEASKVLTSALPSPPAAPVTRIRFPCNLNIDISLFSVGGHIHSLPWRLSLVRLQPLHR